MSWSAFHNHSEAVLNSTQSTCSLPGPQPGGTYTTINGLSSLPAESRVGDNKKIRDYNGIRWQGPGCWELLEENTPEGGMRRVEEVASRRSQVKSSLSLVQRVMGSRAQLHRGWFP